MKYTTIYKYIDLNGGISISASVDESIEYTTLTRISADEGKMITKNGSTLFYFQDVDNDKTDEWFEVDEPNWEEIYAEEAELPEDEEALV